MSALGMMNVPLAIALMSAGAAQAQDIRQDASEEQFEQRIKRALDVNEIQRFYSIYGYQQDKSLFFENIQLFTDSGASAVFQNAEYREKAGLERFWYGHWAHLTHHAFMPVDGLMNDHWLFQPVVTLSEDGQSARLRGHGRGYITSYQGQIRAGSSSESFTDKFVDESGQQQSLGPLALVQDYIYEHVFVKEDDAWKIKRWTICIYATGKYGRGYADIPVPGFMGNSPDAKPGERAQYDLVNQPERPQVLYPENPTGPDRVLSAEETGCFVAKNQVMAYATVVPFSFDNPVTGKPVTWENR